MLGMGEVILRHNVSASWLMTSTLWKMSFPGKSIRADQLNMKSKIGLFGKKSDELRPG